MDERSQRARMKSFVSQPMGPEQPSQDAYRLVLEWLRVQLTSSGLSTQAHLIDRLPRVLPGGDVWQASLPVVQHLPAAVALAGKSVSWDLAAATAHLAAGAAWTQTASYVDHPPGLDFLTQYAHATLAGPVDGTTTNPARLTPSAALGLLLLGPSVTYPAHQHPADEVYLPLTEATWLDEQTSHYTPRAPGGLIHHRPGQVHGMQTTGSPLLALYLWTGDVTTPARFC